MEVVHGIERLQATNGPVFVVVGVFDGIHLGHRYLLDHLVGESARLHARPTVITFDHHPDEVLTGHAPALLIDLGEREARLADAGVAVLVVQHFDEVLRQTPYDAFVARIRERVELLGFLMTPDAAFGYERRGTPDSLRDLGGRVGFEVVVVPPFELDGRAVRSSDIRAEIAAGALARAARLLGRPVTLSGVIVDRGPDGIGLDFELPMALPPAGEYACTVEGRPGRLHVDQGVAYLRADVDLGQFVRVEFSEEPAPGA